MVDQRTIDYMLRYGSSFAQKLADLWRISSKTDRETLAASHGHIFDRYATLARRDA